MVQVFSILAKKDKSGHYCHMGLIESKSSASVFLNPLHAVTTKRPVQLYEEYRFNPQGGPNKGTIEAQKSASNFVVTRNQYEEGKNPIYTPLNYYKV